MRITKAEWSRLGGLQNSYLYRKQGRAGPWRYYAADIEAAKQAAGRINAQS